jgi:uncharacterized protein (TIGR03663 family)
MFDRVLDLSRVNLEVIAYIVVVTLSVIAHLWGLGNMAMHHDESIHAWTSWRFYMGRGDFTCAWGATSQTYCYDPVYHGPSLYILTLLSYFLFGAGDAQARLPMALAGIGLVASCWMLRPYLGRRGALIAALLLGFSPSLLYFTRFARHDGLMVLWELWIVIGFMRYLDTGKAGYLYLLAASLALAIGTHELYYILLFIFGILVLGRLVTEFSTLVRPRMQNPGQLSLYLNLALAFFLAICLFFIVINPPLPVGEGLYLGEKVFLVATTVVLTWLASRVWSKEPVLIPRMVELWREKRHTLWIALGILASLYLVMYTTFFAYPRGAIDGLFAGLAYWLGSQQAYARGDQPWYYYFMQLGIYEPLGIATALGAAIYLFFGKPVTLAANFVGNIVSGLLGDSSQQPNADNEAATSTNGQEQPAEEEQLSARERKRRRREERTRKASTGETIKLSDGASESTPATPAPATGAATLADPLTIVPTGNMFALMLVVWYFSAIVIFSWAGEKMPWLVTHMALPGNLLAAWALAQLLRLLPPLRWRSTPDQQATTESGTPDAQPASTYAWAVLMVPPALIVMVIALSVALWRLFGGEVGQVGQSNMLQGIVPLLIFGGMVFALLTLWSRLSTRVFLAVVGLTVSVVLGAYMVRSTWLAVYTHPDTPVELLVYTQTSPDVPRYVEYVRELAVNQTRNYRSADDVAGGLSMPVIVSGGENSLAWPVQWYLRDFQRIAWKDGEELREAAPETFETSLPDGSTGLTPVLMLSSSHISAETRAFLEDNYVQPFGKGGVFNWWFPEGDKCSPANRGYKRFYFNALTSREQVAEPAAPEGKGCIASNLSEEQAEERVQEILPQLSPPWQPFIWPFLPQNRAATLDFLLFRDLPGDLKPGSRDMELWVRSDLVGGLGGAASTGSSTLRLLAQQTIGGIDTFNFPTGIAVDSRGRIYVADTLNHRVQVYDDDGDLVRSIGEFGDGEEQFNEPRGLAVDEQNNLYVADTWNARIVKISPSGEWLDTWGSGTQDMGNGRTATITDGSEEENLDNPLGFFGPRGIAVDSEGRVFIADTGNKRIVVTDDEGDYLYQWGSAGSEPGQFNEPTGISIDASGLVYVADTWNGRVQVFEQDSEGVVPPLPFMTWRVSGWSANTYDDPSIAVSPEGQVYVSIPARRQVLAATSTGETIVRWGGAGGDMASLQSPSGLAVGPDGDVFVVDRNRAQVLRYTLPELAPE